MNKVHGLPVWTAGGKLYLIELTKPVYKESPKISADRITIFAYSKSQRADFPGLSNESFSEMTDEMMLALNNFSSHGSGWSIN